MTDRECVCTGISLARGIVEGTDNPTLPMVKNVAEKVYNHLIQQANKPQNAGIKSALTKSFEDIRTDIMKDKYADHPGVMAMERVRDEIHHRKELKYLLICGDTFTDAKERDNTIKVMETAWEIMATAGQKDSPYEDTSEAYGPLDDLAKHFNCKS